ncbi:MAG: dimethyl sulfoxide reductase anchor subunit [Hydrogenophaga sp.]|uniref:dimethyl sulfoxide reductase anchor subunit family protein n=1 Tax=Hydrogenophaga sp. TaxID=1904254 RepID=UPI001DCFF62C|nr:DmsC/YnfH family molybdoenzyme membrane anchor subunit [Hydrogenophaga sp.]MBX3608635.1 dimethyl sulfoxide reductase anchor subunit [Hydrogenophaga sp.]
MKPALSIILFTTTAGTAQGLMVVLAVTTLANRPPVEGLLPMLWTATAMLMLALIASFFHLGHPMRAWRAVLMWRTSWMSREVIVLPAFMALAGGWAVWATLADPPTAAAAAPWLAALVIPGALLLWYCTAMIYACIRFVQEWAHPLTVVNYTLLGLASGLVASGALCALAGDSAFAGSVTGWAMATTALAWFTRGLSLRRNARLKPKSTPQSATGIQAARVVQKSMGMTGGSFNTREFFHGATTQVMRKTPLAFQALAFGIPLLLLGWAWATSSPPIWPLAFASQATGLLLERWFFFAQARHPQNIYYQAVS